MGNYGFKVNPPQPGQKCMIIDSAYTIREKFPKTTYGQGTIVTVIGSKDLLCSRPNAPKVTCSLIKMPNGNTDVYFSNSLRPV
jgi:hypothetical protein